MKNYDYYEAVKNDVLDYLKCESGFNVDEIMEDRDEFEQDLNDTLWTHDGVTGNGSGSYTFCRETAKQYVIDNMDLVCEMSNGFGLEYAELGKHFMNEDWEYFDVSIRCYVLSACISDAIDELLEENEVKAC